MVRACLTVVLLLFSSSAFAQHQAFVEALSEFTAALPGTYGDEAVAAQANLDRIERGLAEWDQTLREYANNIVTTAPTASPARALEMHRAMGLHYISRGRYDDAVREFEAATTLSREAQFQMLRGRALDAAGRPADALKAFAAAWTLEPGDPVAAYMLAEAAMRSGAAPPAGPLATLSEVVNRIVAGQDSGDREAFLVTALVPDDLTETPMFVPGAYSAAYAMLKRSDYSKAVDALRAAAARDPMLAPSAGQSPAVLAGAKALHSGLVARAVEEFTAAVRATPSPETHRVLGVAYWLSADHEHAIEHLEDAVRLNPADERARIMLARVLEETGSTDRAERLLAETVTAIPSSTIAHLRLGRLYSAANRTEDAVREYEAAIGIGMLAGEAPLLIEIGALHRRELNGARAESAFARAVARRPNDAVAHRERGRALLQLERPDAALVELAAALLLDPKDYESCLAVGQIHLDAGRFPAAAAVLGYATKIDPDKPEAYYALATALTRAGRQGETKPLLDTFARLQARAFDEQRRRIEQSALRLETSVLVERRQFDRAVAAATRLVADAPDSAANHAALAGALAGQGRLDRAASEYESALTLNAAASVYRQLAALYDRLGRAEAAAATRAKLARVQQRAFGVDTR